MKIDKAYDYIRNLLVSFSYLVLIKNQIIGIILLVLSFVNISAGFLALIAYFSALITGKLIGLNREQMINGLFTYNSILVGLAVGYLYEPSVLSVVLTVTASFFTVLLSFSLFSIFSYYLGLPILNLPFTITATILYLSTMRYGNLFISKNSFYPLLNIPHIPLWLSGLLRSTGILVFMPYDIIGISILLGMLLFSRINFFLIVLGYYTGTIFLGLLKGSFFTAFSDIYSFNFILTSLAVGGFFLIPSRRSYILALSSVLISAFILDAANVFWSSYQIPVFTLPFVSITLITLYVLVVNKFQYLNTSYLASPEQNLEHYINFSNRFHFSLPQPHLPFSGEWKVYQGFDDQWTHKGSWSKAVDFVITGTDDQKTYKNEGKVLDDYYCYKKPVLSPVSGTIMAASDDYDDNPIGTVDNHNKWGNYIIIQSGWGYYVELSHFAKKSLTVKQGDTVRVGQMVGLCGNSGYSPEPHIHFQCQSLKHIGAPTIPFSFTNCVADDKCLFGRTYVRKGQRVKPLKPSRRLNKMLQFILDDQFKYEFYEDGSLLRTACFYIRMAYDGTYYFADNNEQAKLYFITPEGSFAFHRYEGSTKSLLRYLFFAMPSVPLTSENVQWEDTINASLINTANPVYTFLKSFDHSLFKVTGNYSLMEENTIAGSITIQKLFKNDYMKTSMTFAEYKGFGTIDIVTRNHTYQLVLKEE